MMFNRGDYVKVKGHNELGRIYKIHPNEYQVALYNRKDIGSDGKPRFNYGSLQCVVKADKLIKVTI